MKTKLPCFNFTFNNSQDSLDINIDGSIVDAETQQILQDWYGDDTSVSYKSLRNQTAGSTATIINFNINSGGGSVTDAMATHDWMQELKNQGKTVNTFGRGIVGSAATYILMGGTNSSMSENSWFMIHNVSGGIYGNVNDIENYANTMRKFNDRITEFYCNYTGLSSTVIGNMMNAETWMTAGEAKAKNFIKEVTNSATFSNTIDKKNWLFNNMEVLNAYNSSTNKNDSDMINKIVEGIMNAFKEKGIIKVDGAENKPIETISNEAMMEALNTALQPLTTDLDNMVTTAFNNGFEPYKNKLEAFTNLDTVIADATKDFVTLEAYNKLEDRLKATEDELEETKKSVGNKKGSEANPKGKDDKHDPKNMEHKGIRWGHEGE